MSDPYIGEIRIFGFDYAPIGWVFCDGQLLPAAQYQALLAVVGTIYGGDGQNTVGVPNLMGRVPINFGQGTNLSPYAIAAAGGNAAVTLSLSQVANHNHDMAATNSNGTTNNPATLYTGIHNEPAKGYVYKSNPTLDAQFSVQAVGFAGGGQGHENRQPCLPVNFCLAVEGIFPVRS
jgi:microcystin-dependent protein